MKIFSNASVKGYKGEDILTPMGDGKAPSTEFRHALRWVLNNAPFQSQEDCEEGMKLAMAIDKAEGKRVVELEDSTHKWLVRVAKALTPPLFRLNGNIVYKYICEGFKKEEEVRK